MIDYEEKIPYIWREELLNEENDNSISIALMETCGPATLFVYTRCLDLASKYHDMKELRSLFITAATCSTEYRKTKLEKFKT